MARLDINRSGELEVFVRVVQTGSFSAAARDFRMTPSAVSKLVARLEARLGSRLFNRSTRQLSLTQEGRAYYERGMGVLADLDELERNVASQDAPRGRVRINANLAFGYHYLLPLVPRLTAHLPQVKLDLVLTDEVIDVVGQRTDIAVRAGPMKSSNLVARKLGQTRMVIVAAPDYLQRYGTPDSPAALQCHNLLTANYVRAFNGWPLQDGGQVVKIATSGSVQASDGEALRCLALNGTGLARLAAFRVREDIAQGRLVPVMEAFNPGDLEEVHAVFVGQDGHVPLRVRAVLDFLVEHVHVE
ncbi:LysR family transcriptional regulator [Pseudomonas entomophila]|uniref:LysR family transcriptional regulator n=1 Tax=Pseudomonas entomophila TaxID=312306 RepID=UPI0023D8B0E1|nr:LysR family transcriptional regulator [Pseudomonas entomophila]MDF0732074.1 LysR family transcriptional regulator [Pseudomonas entomophila]